jgi:hypothetical protein
VLVEDGPLDVVLRTKFVINEALRADVAQLALHVAPFVARGDVVQVENPIQILVDLDQHAFTETRGLD